MGQPITPGLYKGYSSFEFQKNKTFRLNDIELVKMDLLNHIFTARGERVGMAQFGTGIPRLVFEPLDEETIEAASEDVRMVIDFDPRVRLVQFFAVPDFDNNSLALQAQIYYVELDLTDNFELNLVFGD